MGYYEKDKPPFMENALAHALALFPAIFFATLGWLFSFMLCTAKACSDMCTWMLRGAYWPRDY